MAVFLIVHAPVVLHFGFQDLREPRIVIPVHLPHYRGWGRIDDEPLERRIVRAVGVECDPYFGALLADRRYQNPPGILRDALRLLDPADVYALLRFDLFDVVPEPFVNDFRTGIDPLDGVLGYLVKI